MGSSDDGVGPPRSGRLPGVVLPPSHRDVDVVESISSARALRPVRSAAIISVPQGALKIQARQRLQLDGQDLPVPTCFLRQAVVGEEALHYHDNIGGLLRHAWALCALPGLC